MTKISKGKRAHLLAACGVLADLEASRAKLRRLEAELREIRRGREAPRVAGPCNFDGWCDDETA